MLFEDVPGTAKTVLARAIAGSIEDAVPSRIQCTPDLQPTDVTGLSVFDQQRREFEFRPGPLFANVLLVDEINRAMPKTQSALLEAMAERQVTVDGVTRALPEPFFLIATENPIEYEGTFPLPEAQLDRFAVRSSLGYPGEAEELLILREQRHGHPLEGLVPVISLAELHELRRARRTSMSTGCSKAGSCACPRDPSLARGRGRRLGSRVARAGQGGAGLGASPRTALREAGDIEELFIPVLGHRLMITPVYLAETRSVSRDEMLQRIRTRCLDAAPAPRPDWKVEGPGEGVEWAARGEAA